MESLECDGRFCAADLRSLGVGYREQPLASDFVVVDETRVLSSLPDLGESFLNYLVNQAASKKLALLYANDDVNFLRFPAELLTFLPHQCRGFTKNPNALPVAWGFTLEGFEASKLRLGSLRDPRKIVQNFNPTESQTVREALVAILQVTDLLNLSLDKRHLHGDAYSDQLAGSQFCLAMGGTFHWPKSDYSWMRERMDERNLTIDVFPDRSKTVGIMRWDSFRFWEAMAFGCLPIQLDMHEHGFLLPHMPQKWLHYIPLDLARVHATVEKMNELSESPDLLRFMSESAAAWAYEHAHPVSLYNWVSENAQSRFA